MNPLIPILNSRGEASGRGEIDTSHIQWSGNCGELRIPLGPVHNEIVIHGRYEDVMIDRTVGNVFCISIDGFDDVMQYQFIGYTKADIQITLEVFYHEGYRKKYEDEN